MLRGRGMLTNADGSRYECVVDPNTAVTLWMDKRLTPLHRLIYDDVEIVFRDVRMLSLNPLFPAFEETDMWEIAMDTNAAVETAGQLIRAGKDIVLTADHVLAALAEVEKVHPEVADVASVFRKSLQSIKDKVVAFDFAAEVARCPDYRKERNVQAKPDSGKEGSA